jgi:hypothetical protein
MKEHGRTTDPSSSETDHDMEEYAGGYIKARVGRIPVWLLVVYAVLFIFALVYLIVHWGYLGPGRIQRIH